MRRFSIALVFILLVAVSFHVPSDALAGPSTSPHPAVYTFSNTTSIAIPATGDSGPANPYPSTIAVSGIPGSEVITDVDVTLTGLSHTSAMDLDILLVGPTGANVMLMSDACGPFTINFNVTFSDGSPALVIFCSGGTFSPTDVNIGVDSMSAPAPAGPYGATLSVFNGTNPNGTWSLYVMDDQAFDTGSMTGGWSMTITTGPTTPLAITPICASGSAAINITAGDGPFTINGTRDGVPQPTINAPTTGSYTLIGDSVGPNVFNYTVTELGGNGESISGSITCNVPNIAGTGCSGASLVVVVVSGDLPMTITYDLDSITQTPITGVGLGNTFLASDLEGPNTYSLLVTETIGDNQTLGGTVTCNVPLVASAVCVGDNLQVTTTQGDGPFTITGTGPTIPGGTSGLAVTTLTGPGTWTGVTVTETEGDTTNLPLGNFTCFATPPALVINVTDNQTTEAGATGTIEVSLSTPPAANVTVPYVTTNPSEGTVSGSPLTFDASNWNTPQIVTVTGFDDFIDDGNIPYAINFGPTVTTDPNFSGLVGSANLTNIDNDTASVSVTELEAPMQTSEAGDTAQFSVVLTSQPTATVTINTLSDNTAEGQVTSGASLNFDAGNWNIPQTVTVTGQDDALFDGDIPYNANWSSSSADGLYNAWTGNVALTNLDDEDLVVSASCAAGSATVAITGGDAPFTIDWSLDGTPQVSINAPTTGNYTLSGNAAGPNVFAYTVTEQGSNNETYSDTITCNVPVNTTTLCAADGGLDIIINAGDVPFALTYVLNGTPIPPSIGYPLGLLHLGPALDGPSAFTSINLAEMSGDLQDAGIPDTSCNVPLNVTAVCNGDNLDVTISNGDGPFNITGTGNGLPTSVGVGTTTLTGPGAWLGVTVTETQGDTTNQLLGDFACSTTPPALVINATDNTSGEDGSTATVEVSLASPPFADVTVPYSSSDTSEGTVTGSPLTFTPANWMTPQVVTMTGVDDLVDDGDIGYTLDFGPTTSVYAPYVGLTGQANLTNLDNDTAGITVTELEAPMQTDEAGDTAQFSVVLLSQPTADVTITTISTNPAEGQVTGGASLTFTAGNWNTPQTVTITGQDDPVDDGDMAYGADWSSSSADGLYNTQSGSVGITNLDNDTAGVTVTPLEAPMQTDEAGDTAQFSVVLTSQPTADVTITTISTNPAEGQVTGGASLTFNAGNWMTPQTVTVTGQDDPVDDGDMAYSADWSSASADSLYNVQSGSVGITNLDNDSAGVTITLLEAPMQTDEAGNTAQFSVVLTSQPTADVTITTVSTNTAEGQVTGGASLTFNAGNWMTPQTVTVTGQDDAVDDGDIAYSADWSSASADGLYNVQSGSVGITNLDNDTAGITVTLLETPMQTDEAGDTAQFSVVLTSQPAADVTITTISTNTAEGTITGGASLTFNAGNWMTPQTVTVTGQDDAIDDGDIAYNANWSATSADGLFNVLFGTVGITNLDNDSAGLGIAAINPFEVNEEGATSTNFFVSLNTQPTAAVAVNVTNSDGQCTVTPAVLNFDAGNWGTMQEVIVTAVDDAVVEGTHACDIDLLSASTDTNYNALSQLLTFTVFDNDAPEIILTPAAFFTWEEGEPVSTYTVELGASPAVGETVTVDIEIVALQLVSQAPIQVTFDESNWNVAVEIDVQPLDDGIDEGVTVEIITHTATSDLLGSAWEGVTADLTLTIFDTQALAFPPEFHTPNIGEIMITLAQTQQPYDRAGGEPIYLPSGAPLLLPHDYDGNGFDTYTVTETQTVAGETWYGIFIGNATWVWVPAENVTVLR